MAGSTYTANLGIQKPATGEQAGAWGASVNTNMDQIDLAIGGSTSVELTATGSAGTPNTILIIDTGGYANLSPGKHAFIEITDNGSLASNPAFIELDPATSERIVWIYNNMSTGTTLTVSQGTTRSTVVTIQNGNVALCRFDGGDTTATVTNLLDQIQVGSKIAFPNNAGTGEISISTDANDDITVTVNGTDVLQYDLSDTQWDVKGNVLTFTERAAQITPGAGFGQLWVKNDTPCKLYYTDDTGADFDLTSGAGGGFTDPMTTNGDIIWRTGDAAARLGIGSTGQYLKVTGANTIAWATFTGLSDPTTTQGDLIYNNGSILTRLARGSSGQVLTMTSSTQVGWATPSSGGATTYIGLTDTPAGYGTNGQYVTTTGSALTYTTLPVTFNTVSATSPLNGSGSGTNTVTLTIDQADTVTSGYITSTDWNTFNNKVTNIGSNGTITVGGSTQNPTVSVTPNLSITSLTLTGALSGSGTGSITNMTSITGSGTVTGSSFNATSARALKKCIKDFTGAINVRKLKPVTYKLKSDEKGKTQLGYIAEDVAEVFPEVVAYDDNGNPSGIDYSRLAVPAIQMINELFDRLAYQGEKIRKLEEALQGAK